MKFGVIVFPGSNCDHDMMHVLGNVLDQEVIPLWHKETNIDKLSPSDCIVVPGGFSYGDYLRPGAIAKFSPIMQSVVDFASNGGKVLGICNGFQVLCEAGLLPGVLLPNENQKFINRNIHMKTITTDSFISSNLKPNQCIQIPIAHADGRYYCDTETLMNLNQNNQIIFKYCDEEGQIHQESNPNGSIENIAGICNEKRNVIGMMPHPERAAEKLLGNIDGYDMLVSILEHENFL